MYDLLKYFIFIFSAESPKINGITFRRLDSHRMLMDLNDADW